MQLSDSSYLLCRISPWSLDLNGNPATFYRSGVHTYVRITKPSDVFHIKCSRMTISITKQMVIILPSSQMVSSPDCEYLQDCIKHILTEFTVDSLVINPQELELDLAGLESRGLLLWLMGAGYKIDLSDKIEIER